MKLTGFGFDFDKIEDYDFRIKECTITDTKLSMDFESSDGTPMHALLRSDDGSTYSGNFGIRVIEKVAFMEAFRYQSKDGETLLLVNWHRTDNGMEGTSLIRLNSDWG